MSQNKQKKGKPLAKSELIEGISKKINKQFQKIVEEFQESSRIKNQQKKAQHEQLCHGIEDLAVIANDGYRLFIGDCKGLTVNSRNPLLLVKYTQLFLKSLLEIKKSEIEQKKVKVDQNQSTITTYNQNNIYELVAKKNIEFAQLRKEIVELKTQLGLANKRTIIAEQMTQNIKQQANSMLSVYRANFIKMSDFLKLSQQKQTELMQSNRLLSEQMQSIVMQFDMYKNNFKRKTTGQEKERRLKERLQKQFQDKLQLATKQVEYRYKQLLQNK